MVILKLPKHVVVLEMIKMELNDREKFVAHFIATRIMGLLDNAPTDAVLRTIEKLRLTRCRKLSCEEAEDIVSELTDEVLLGTGVLSEMHRISSKQIGDDKLI